MTQVRIPPVLRESAGGVKQVELEGGTIGEVLERLVERFPGLRDQLFTERGELNRFVNVYLNDEDVRYLSELETPAGERDTIVVLPAMAGGAVTSRWPAARCCRDGHAAGVDGSRPGPPERPPGRVPRPSGAPEPVRYQGLWCYPASLPVLRPFGPVQRACACVGKRRQAPYQRSSAAERASSLG